MKKFGFATIFAAICVLMSSCAIGINLTKDQSTPVINSFDFQANDCRIVRTVHSEFKATYVLGIGGLGEKARVSNAIEMLYKQADLTRKQQVVNITTHTHVNIIVGGLVVRRVTTAQGVLIEPASIPASEVQASIQNENIQEDYHSSEEKLAIEEMHEKIKYTQYDGSTSNVRKAYLLVFNNFKERQEISQIQSLVLQYINTNGKSVPNLKEEIKSCGSDATKQFNVFCKYIQN